MLVYITDWSYSQIGKQHFYHLLWLDAVVLITCFLHCFCMLLAAFPFCHAVESSFIYTLSL